MVQFYMLQLDCFIYHFGGELRPPRGSENLTFMPNTLFFHVQIGTESVPDARSSLDLNQKE